MADYFTFVSRMVAAYLIGSVPTAYLVSRWRRGIDIRQYGSGNVGASNVLAIVSKRWSMVVTVFDFSKGAIMVVAAQLLGLGTVQQVTIGIATIIGHNWPIFLRFQGGRGVLTSLGVITLLSPKLGLIALAFAYLLAPFRQMSLGVTFALVSLPVISWLFSQPLGIGEPLPTTLGLIAILLIVISKRLSVPRSPLSTSVPSRELFINRLLFDRDIRDRKTWISQTRFDPDSIEHLIEQDQEEELKQP
ncbi:MAG: glycerol-3-phosphate acyltransferase [Dehalococcoidales bacterium]|nr:glycerol-3-phosphate acyltransferase [Dehalococcoidales bacterium]